MIILLGRFSRPEGEIEPTTFFSTSLQLLRGLLDNFGVDSRSSFEVQSAWSFVYDCYDFYEPVGDGWVTLLYGSCYDVFVCYRRVRVIVWVLCGYRRIIIVIAQTLWEITSFAKYFRVALPST